MTHVFVSYSHSDTDFAELLRIKVTEAKMDVWIDHAGLKSGTDWRQSIDDAIGSAFAVVFVMSPSSAASQYCTYEWAYAHGLGKPIVPLLYQSVDLHPKLSVLQYLDFTHQTMRPWSQLTDRLSELASSYQ